MDVVSASVHDADVLSLRVGRAHLRGVIEAGLLLYRERIHIGANQQARSSAVLQDGDDAEGLRSVLVFAHVLGDRVSQLAQFARK